MRTSVKRFVAAVCGAVTMVAPGMAGAEVPCQSYFQVKSNATGGDFVGGLLFSEGEKEVTISQTSGASGSTTTSVSSELSGPGAKLSGDASSTTSASSGANVVVSGSYNVGVYKMNDGSTWLVNCDTGLQLIAIG